MPAAVAALTVLAAALRFGSLDVQSLWLDEANTSLILQRDLGDVWDGILLEASPPLYYYVAAVWAKLFGTGEVGLRSLSALAGTALVPVAYLAARRLVDRRVALLATAFVAVAPVLVWYSQEIRTYSLVVLFATLSLLFFARTVDDPTRGNVAGFAAASIAALLTHYFAVFLIAAEAAWLLARDPRSRRIWIGIAPIAGVGLALVPLVLEQIDNGGGAFVGRSGGLADRMTAIPATLIRGESPSAFPAADEITLLLALAAIALVFLATTAPERRRLIAPLAIGAAVALTPPAVAVVGPDTVVSRNFLMAWVPLAVCLAGGCLATRAGRWGVGIAAALLGCFIAIVLAVNVDPDLQRDDWRQAVAMLGTGERARLLVVDPAYNRLPLRYYRPSVQDLGSRSPQVSEIVRVHIADRFHLDANRPELERVPLPGFRVSRVRRDGRITEVTFRSAEPAAASAAAVAEGSGTERLGVVLQPRGR